MRMLKGERYYYVDFRDVKGVGEWRGVFGNGYKIGIVGEVE